jgi:hypothetical protein
VEKWNATRKIVSEEKGGETGLVHGHRERHNCLLWRRIWQKDQVAQEKKSKTSVKVQIHQKLEADRTIRCVKRWHLSTFGITFRALHAQESRVVFLLNLFPFTICISKRWE